MLAAVTRVAERQSDDSPVNLRLYDLKRQIQVLSIVSNGSSPNSFEGFPRIEDDFSQVVFIDPALGHRAELPRVTINLANNLFARVVEGDEAIVLTNLLSGEECVIDLGISSIDLIRLAPDGSTLAVLGDSKLFLHELASGQNAVARCKDARRVRFTEDATVLLTVDSEKPLNVRCWNVQTASEMDPPPESARYDMRLFLNSRENSIHLAYSADCRFQLLSEMGWPGQFVLFDLRSGAEHVLEKRQQRSRTAAFAADGRLAADGGFADVTYVWDPRAGKTLAELPTGTITHTTFSPDGKTLVTAGDDLVIRLWDPIRLTERHSLRGHTDTIWHATFSRDGKRLASTSWDRTVKLWDSETGKLLGSYEYPENEIWTSFFNHDGTLLVTLSKNALLVRRAPRGLLLNLPHDRQRN